MSGPSWAIFEIYVPMPVPAEEMFMLATTNITFMDIKRGVNKLTGVPLTVKHPSLDPETETFKSIILATVLTRWMDGETSEVLMKGPVECSIPIMNHILPYTEIWLAGNTEKIPVAGLIDVDLLHGRWIGHAPWTSSASTTMYNPLNVALNVRNIKGRVFLHENLEHMAQFEIGERDGLD